MSPCVAFFIWQLLIEKWSEPGSITALFLLLFLILAD